MIWAWRKCDYIIKLKEYAGIEKECDPFFGVVYILEYGNYIKIGSTSNICKRYNQIKHHATDYCNVNIGKCFYTIPHTNYKKNELYLHKKFNCLRKDKTELFNTNIEDFIKKLNIDLSFLEHYVDNSEYLLDATKNMLCGVNDDQIIKCSKDTNIEKKFREIYCTFCSNEEFELVMETIQEMNSRTIDSPHLKYLIIKMENIINNANEKYFKALIQQR